MPKFRKKPVVIEAVLWTGSNIDEVNKMAGLDHGTPYFQSLDNLVINTIDGGDAIAEPGTYVIKGVKNELYPCKADIFAASYEPVELNERTLID